MGSTSAISSNQAQSEAPPASEAAVAGTTKIPVPSSEVASSPIPCQSPRSFFNPDISFCPD